MGRGRRGRIRRLRRGLHVQVGWRRRRDVRVLFLKWWEGDLWLRLRVCRRRRLLERGYRCFWSYEMYHITTNCALRGRVRGVVVERWVKLPLRRARHGRAHGAAPTTSSPSYAPTVEKTEEPTPRPTHDPTKAPKPRPTPVPSYAPSTDPTIEPTEMPTYEPSKAPTPKPSPAPTSRPSPEPSYAPTVDPTLSPRTRAFIASAHGPPTVLAGAP